MKKAHYFAFSLALLLLFAGSVHALTPPRPDELGNQSVIKATAHNRVCYNFTRNLGWGSRNVEVKNLQKILNNDSETRVSFEGSGSLGNETEYYGLATMRAVAKFQKKHGVVATGFVGPLTRAKLQENFACETSQTIEVISPAANQSWVMSTNKQIRWNGGTTTQVSIKLVYAALPCDLSTCAAAGIAPSYIISSSTANVGFYNWKVGEVVNPRTLPVDVSYAIQICEIDGGKKCGWSNPFVINEKPPAQTTSLKVIAPTGGETLVSGSNNTIRWSGGMQGDVSIHLSRYVPCRNGICPNVDFGSPLTIVATTKNDGSYVWKTGTFIEKILLTFSGEQYVITVCELDGVKKCAAGEPFKIVSAANSGSSLKVTAPNAGEELEEGRFLQIKWSGGSTANVSIRLEEYDVPCGGPTCPAYVTGFGKVISSTTPNDGLFSWSIGKFDGTDGSVRFGQRYLVVVCELEGLVCDAGDVPSLYSIQKNY
jgi:peptidoglycan hydrolase-like protein with peptidoglycan-binding domain